jgi:hypothetical protein
MTQSSRRHGSSPLSSSSPDQDQTAGYGILMRCLLKAHKAVISLVRLRERAVRTDAELLEHIFTLFGGDVLVSEKLPPQGHDIIVSVRAAVVLMRGQVAAVFVKLRSSGFAGVSFEHMFEAVIAGSDCGSCRRRGVILRGNTMIRIASNELMRFMVDSLRPLARRIAFRAMHMQLMQAFVNDLELVKGVGVDVMRSERLMMVVMLIHDCLSGWREF